ncbi:MAG: DUF1573 domain-containing protein [Verrucomicrobia bacterium]|nr:MAG: DUF1573 domain-containing protein [Verrucomicrobiota bacterium]
MGMKTIRRILWVTFFLGHLYAWSTPEHAPKLVCEQPEFNFGERESSGELAHDFVIRNAGDLTLQIFNLRPTCGCLVPKFTDRLIPPGGEATITVQFTLRGRQGPQHKLVYIDSNDPSHPAYALHMVGQITDTIEIEPRLLFFGRIQAQAAITGTVMMTASGTNLLGPVTAQLESAAFTVNVGPVMSNKTAQLTVVSKPPLPEGLTRTTLQIHTGNQRLPIMTMTISAFVPGVFSILPPELLIVGREGERVRRELFLRTENNTAFRVLAVEPPVQEIASTVTATNSAAYRIEFNNLPVMRSLEGQTVRIVTDHPTRPEILIPIRVFVR